MADWIPVYTILAFIFALVVLNLIENKRID